MGVILVLLCTFFVRGEEKKEIVARDYIDPVALGVPFSVSVQIRREVESFIFTDDFHTSLSYGMDDKEKGCLSEKGYVVFKSSSPTGYFVSVTSQERSHSEGSSWLLTHAEHGEHQMGFILLGDRNVKYEPTPIQAHGMWDHLSGGTKLLEKTCLYRTKKEDREVKTIGCAFYILQGELVDKPAGRYRANLHFFLSYY